MGRTPLILLALLAIGLAGCEDSKAPKTKADATKEILAPTDVNKMSPEMRAMIPKTDGQPPNKN